MKKILIVLILAIVAVLAVQMTMTYRSTHRIKQAGEAGLKALAAKVSSADVIMYSTNECTYCHQAKNWLNEHGFAFTECNMSTEQRCEDEFRSYGANGTPFLVIRRGGKEHLMKQGFDSDEFLSALST